MNDARRDMIVTTLRSLRYVGETLQRGDAGGRFEPGSKMLTMPAAWHAGCPENCLVPSVDPDTGRLEIRCNSTYAQLLMALSRLHRMGPRHYWHVRERYLVSEILNRDLINRNGRYFEAVAHVIDFDGELVRYETGDPLGKNHEVVKAVAQPKAVVARKPGDPRMVLVRAIVERWDSGVEARPLSLALDVLSSFMPRRIVLPRDVLAAA